MDRFGFWHWLALAALILLTLLMLARLPRGRRQRAARHADASPLISYVIVAVLGLLIGASGYAAVATVFR